MKPKDNCHGVYATSIIGLGRPLYCRSRRKTDALLFCRAHLDYVFRGGVESIFPDLASGIFLTKAANFGASKRKCTHVPPGRTAGTGLQALCPGSGRPQESLISVPPRTSRRAPCGAIASTPAVRAKAAGAWPNTKIADKGKISFRIKPVLDHFRD